MRKVIPFFLIVIYVNAFCILTIDIVTHSFHYCGVKTLTVREVPDSVYTVLKKEAQTNCRSLQEQVRWVLAKETRLRRGGFMEAARHWRKTLAGRALGDTVADIHAGRERR